MKQVRAGGNYEKGTYEIRGGDGKWRKIPEYNVCSWHASPSARLDGGRIGKQLTTSLVATANKLRENANV